MNPEKRKQEQFHLTESQTEDVCEFLTSTLDSKVKKVVASTRLFKSPAIVTGHENASITAMMQLTGGGAAPANPPVQLEINPGHKVLRGLFYTMSEDKELAKKVARQLFAHAMIDAGLYKDSRGFLGRMNDLMAAAMDVDGIEMELREKIAKGQNLGGKN